MSVVSITKTKSGLRNAKYGVESTKVAILRLRLMPRRIKIVIRFNGPAPKNFLPFVQQAGKKKRGRGGNEFLPACFRAEGAVGVEIPRAATFRFSRIFDKVGSSAVVKILQK